MDFTLVSYVELSWSERYGLLLEFLFSFLFLNDIVIFAESVMVMLVVILTLFRVAFLHLRRMSEVILPSA